MSLTEAFKPAACRFRIAGQFNELGGVDVSVTREAPRSIQTADTSFTQNNSVTTGYDPNTPGGMG